MMGPRREYCDGQIRAVCCFNHQKESYTICLSEATDELFEKVIYDSCIEKEKITEIDDVKLIFRHFKLNAPLVYYFDLVLDEFTCRDCEDTYYSK